jgi:hypothetical protein
VCRRHSCDGAKTHRARPSPRLNPRKDNVIGKDQRVLVTGGAGLIGSSIVECLVEGREGVTASEIIAVDNFTRGRRDNLTHCLGGGTVTIVDGDLRAAGS